MTALIVDDDAAVRGLVRDQLEARGIAVTIAATAAEAREAFRHQTFATVVLDIALPDDSGLTVLEDLRREGSTSYVIILSGAGSEVDRVTALDLGADDYVVKPFFARELTARVLAVRRRRDRDSDSRLQIGHLDIDLDSRRVFAFGDELELTAKEFDLLAFLAARPGHVFGRDELLRSVWQSAADWQQVATVTEHVRRLRSKIEIDPQRPQLLRTVRGIGYRLDASPDDSPPIDPVASTGEEDIRRGLDNDEFDVWYQPTVVLRDGRIVAVEALVRWNHPQRGVLSPIDFIVTTEDCGLIVELGAVVLDRACRQVVEWRRAGLDLELAVNLSGKELADPALAGRIAATLEASGLSPSVLWLEVTETALVVDYVQAEETLRKLAEGGVRIAIDDFGTGWASLTYLKRFRVHALKIDQTFVVSLDGNVNDTAIVRSILSLGKELGLNVIAEGVETEAQRDALLALGCVLGQGYLYGRPTVAADVPLEPLQRGGEPAVHEETEGVVDARLQEDDRGTFVGSVDGDITG